MDTEDGLIPLTYSGSISTGGVGGGGVSTDSQYKGVSMKRKRVSIKNSPYDANDNIIIEDLLEEPQSQSPFDKSSLLELFKLYLKLTCLFVVVIYLGGILLHLMSNSQFLLIFVTDSTGARRGMIWWDGGDEEELDDFMREVKRDSYFMNSNVIQPNDEDEEEEEEEAFSTTARTLRSVVNSEARRIAFDEELMRGRERVLTMEDVMRDDI